jgi:hypothetical protein
MTETTAAQTDPLDAFVQEAIDQDSNDATQESHPVESAPITEEVKPEPTKEPEHDGFQKRINKVTARAYEAERKLAAYESAQKPVPVETVTAPTLEAHDYDEEAFNVANTQHLVRQEMDRQLQVQNKASAEVEAQRTQAEFGERITALNKDDFDVKAQSIPDLPEGVADALIGSKDGAELIYHLGTHLDQADALAQMTPSQALMEIGRMSLSLNKKPEIKLSAAPEPIEPLRAGSAIKSDIDGEMSIDAWMSKYN